MRVVAVGVLVAVVAAGCGEGPVGPVGPEGAAGVEGAQGPRGGGVWTDADGEVVAYVATPLDRALVAVDGAFWAVNPITAQFEATTVEARTWFSNESGCTSPLYYDVSDLHPGVAYYDETALDHGATGYFTFDTDDLLANTTVSTIRGENPPSCTATQNDQGMDAAITIQAINEFTTRLVGPPQRMFTAPLSFSFVE